MKVESTALSGANFKASDQSAPEPGKEQKKVASEEILTKIKDLTEDGLYSIQFEMNKEIDELVIKVVDKESGELIRQIPPDELISATRGLKDFRGLIIETES